MRIPSVPNTKREGRLRVELARSRDGGGTAAICAKQTAGVGRVDAWCRKIEPGNETERTGNRTDGGRHSTGAGSRWRRPTRALASGERGELAGRARRLLFPTSKDAGPGTKGAEPAATRQHRTSRRVFLATARWAIPPTSRRNSCCGAPLLFKPRRIPNRAIAGLSRLGDLRDRFRPRQTAIGGAQFVSASMERRHRRTVRANRRLGRGRRRSRGDSLAHRPTFVAHPIASARFFDRLAGSAVSVRVDFGEALKERLRDIRLLACGHAFDDVGDDDVG